MEREGLRYWDLQLHSEQYISAFKQMVDNLILERFDPTSPRVAKIINRYRVRAGNVKGMIPAINESVLHQLTINLASGTNHFLDENRQNKIESLLLGNSDWIIYDYYLLRLSAGMMSSERLSRCLLKATKQNLRQKGKYASYYLQAMEQCYVISLLRHDGIFSLTAANKLDSIHVDYFDGYDSLTIHFLRIMRDYTGTIQQQKYTELLNAIRCLGLKQMMSYFANLHSAITEGKELVLL